MPAPTTNSMSICVPTTASHSTWCAMCRRSAAAPSPNAWTGWRVM